MSDSQATLYRIENSARFSSDSELGTETCVVCLRTMEERWRDLWFVNDLRMGHEPIQGPGQRLVCSRACLSQLVYDQAPEDVRSLMRMLARQIHDWSENVNLKSMDWCLRHSFLTFAVSQLDFIVHDDQMENFAAELLGRDWRDQDYPKWFSDAITPVAPAKPVEFVHLGIGGGL